MAKERNQQEQKYFQIESLKLVTNQLHVFHLLVLLECQQPGSSLIQRELRPL